MAQSVVIPYAPRHWAQELHGSLKRWAALVLCRRAGKTTGILNHHQRAATDDAWELRRLRTQLPGTPETTLRPLLRQRHYGHVMPTMRQAKLVAWDMLKYYAQPIPGAIPNEVDLCVRYPNGCRVQLFGADNPDGFRGLGFSGISFDEYSQQPPNLFSEVISKALADHLGYAIFAGTIKGKDHLWRTHDSARVNPEWLTIWRDVDAILATESGITIQAITQALEDDRKLVAQGLMTQAEFDQEWYLSVDAAVKGAYYIKQLTQARADGRITRVPYEPLLPVDTTWDLGISDSMAIWFSQSLRSGEVRIIDYYEASDEGMPFYVRVLADRGYVYGKHWAPHDIRVRELSTGKSRLETAASLGIKFEIVPDIPVKDGIDAARLLLATCWFDETKTEAGRNALAHYRKGWNQQLQEYKDAPVHNWAEHGASSFRYLAVWHKTPAEARQPVTGDGRGNFGERAWMA